MRKNDYLANILLAAVLALTVLGFLLARTLFPTVVLPAWNIPNLIIVCMAALVAAAYLNPGARYSWWLSALLAGVTVTALPAVAGLVETAMLWKLAVAGTLVYLGCERIFCSVTDRLSSGPAGKLAILSAGLTMCLLGQIFSGMFL